MSSAPKIYNVTCTSANTEYSQALTSFTSSFVIKPRDPTRDIKIAFVALTSGTVYWTVFGGASDEEIGQPFTGVVTVYFQSTQPGTIVEIIEITR